MKRNNNYGHRLRWSRSGKCLTANCQLCGKPAGSGVECPNKLELFSFHDLIEAVKSLA